MDESESLRRDVGARLGVDEEYGATSLAGASVAVTGDEAPGRSSTRSSRIAHFAVGAGILLAAMLGVAGMLPDRRPSDATATSMVAAEAAAKSEGRATTTYTSFTTVPVAAEMQEITDALNIVNSWDDGVNILCSDSSFAFCAHATCHNVNDQTALCGCSVETATEGQFSFSKASLVLMRSATYRNSIFKIDAGTFSTSDNAAFCAALDDGSVFKAAGFQSDYGSFFLMPDSDSSAPSSALRASAALPSTTTSSSSAAAALFPLTSSSQDVAPTNSDAFVGSCMGAPCKLFDWGTDCTVVCACTEYPSEPKDDDNEECFRNGPGGQTDHAWSKDVENLLEYIDSVRHTIDNMSTIVQAISAENDGNQVCGGVCTVER